MEIPPPISPTQSKKPAWNWTALGLVAICLGTGVVGGLGWLASSSDRTSAGLSFEITDAKGVPMRIVPAGEFSMGAKADDALTECQIFRSDCKVVRREQFTNEEPPHKVSLDGYYMDVYEVTNARYQACVDAGSCTPPQDAKSPLARASYYGNSAFDSYPVISVDWNQATAYCEWRGARLPSEAEWEHAARGGLDGKNYPWGDIFEAGQANFCDTNCTFDWKSKTVDDGYPDTSPVGSYAPNGYGLYDVAGNVWEWTADLYAADYYATLGQNAVNPQGPASGDSRVLRGGSWVSLPYDLRVSGRYWNTPVSWDYSFGFRCTHSAASP